LRRWRRRLQYHDADKYGIYNHDNLYHDDHNGSNIADDGHADSDFTGR
jgi:hypothetical protein